MSALPPVILVLDINALSTATPREWMEFSRVGSCIIPQVVYEEMKFLFDRSPDPDLERIAKAFTRFYASSGWKVSEAQAHHPLLKSSTNQSLTKRARVSLAVGRCAYAISESFSSSLVVLVSSDRSMLQRIYDIQAANLCAITGQSLLQWCRTGQRPIAVSQKIQRIRAVNDPSLATGFSAIPTSSIRTTSTSRINTTIPSSRTVTPSSRTRSRTVVRDASNIKFSEGLEQLIRLGLAVGGLALGVWLLWTVFRSVDFTDWKEPLGSPSTDNSLFQRDHQST